MEVTREQVIKVNRVSKTLLNKYVDKNLYVQHLGYAIEDITGHNLIEATDIASRYWDLQTKAK